MGRLCSICNHPEREKINAAIVNNDGYQRIATDFSTGETTLSESAVRRHKQNCIKNAIEAAQVVETEQTVRMIEEGDQQQKQFVWNILGRIEWLDTQIRLIYEETRAEKDHKASISALSEYRQQTKLFSELLQGNEPDQAEKLEAEWILVRETIFRALEPYPEARLAVARALLALGRGDDHEPEGQLLQAPASGSTR